MILNLNENKKKMSLLVEVYKCKGIRVEPPDKKEKALPFLFYIEKSIFLLKLQYY